MRHIYNERNEEYLKLTSEIHSMYINIYMDYFYLIEIEEIYNNSIIQGNNMLFVGDMYSFIKTIIFALQKDFALLFWKINIDNDPKANSIKRFKSRLNQSYLINKNSFKDKFILNNNPSGLKILEDLRNTSIAHLDINKKPLKITFTDIIADLELSRKYFNKMLFDEANQYEITDKKLEELKTKAKNGVVGVLNGIEKKEKLNAQ